MARHRLEDGFWSYSERLPVLGTLRRLSKFGQPQLRFKDVFKRDMKLTGINPNTWKSTAASRESLRAAVRSGVQKAETSSLTREPGGRIDQRIPGHRPPLSAVSVQETAFPEWASTATPGSVLAILVLRHHLPR